MTRRLLPAASAIAVGLTLALPGVASAADGTGVIYAPEDFNPAYSDTRATGHYEIVGTSLRVWTEGSTGTDKVAEYIDTSTPLADAGEPALVLTNQGTTATEPGFQLVVDFDADGTPDGILVGEPNAYGDAWWLNNAAKQFVKDGVPTTGGSGSAWSATLDQWRLAFPDANVVAFGFSLGSGVLGDWLIDEIRFAGTTYSFAEHVVLTSKDQCKDGGWATSTMPVYKNQGECVSSYASVTSQARKQNTVEDWTPAATSSAPVGKGKIRLG